MKKSVNDMTPFELKRWSALIDGVQIINNAANRRGEPLTTTKLCNEYLRPKDILTYMEEASNKMR